MNLKKKTLEMSPVLELTSSEGVLCSDVLVVELFSVAVLGSDALGVGLLSDVVLLSFSKFC